MTLSMQSTLTSETSLSPYIVKVKGYQSSYSTYSVFFTYQVLIQIACQYSTITSTAISDYTFDISTATATITTLAWTHTLSSNGCSLVYTLVQSASPATTADAIFSISGTNDITITTSSSGKVGTYPLRALATVGSGASTTTGYRDFTVTVTNLCGSNVITPVSISN